MLNSIFTPPEKDFIFREAKGAIGMLVAVSAVGSIVIPTILVPTAAKLLTRHRHKVDDVVRHRKLPVSSAWMDTWELVRTQPSNRVVLESASMSPDQSPQVKNSAEARGAAAARGGNAKWVNTNNDAASNPGKAFLDMRLGWKSEKNPGLRHGARTGAVLRLMNRVKSRAADLLWEEGLTILICLFAQKYVLRTEGSGSTSNSAHPTIQGDATNPSSTSAMSWGRIAFFFVYTNPTEDALHRVFKGSLINMFAFTLSDQFLWILNVLPCRIRSKLLPPDACGGGGEGNENACPVSFGGSSGSQWRITKLATRFISPIFVMKSLLRMAHCAPVLSRSEWIKTQGSMTPKDIVVSHVFTSELPKLIRITCGLVKSIYREEHPSNFGLKPAAVFQPWAGKPGSNYDVNKHNRAVHPWLDKFLEGRRGYILFTHVVGAAVNIGVVYGFAVMGEGAALKLKVGGGGAGTSATGAAGSTCLPSASGSRLFRAVDAVEQGLSWAFGKVLFSVFDKERGGPYLFGILGRAVGSSFD